MLIVLILLSDVDGLYTDNPKKNKKTKLIKVVKEIDENIKNMHPEQKISMVQEV